MNGDGLVTLLGTATQLLLLYARARADAIAAGTIADADLPAVTSIQIDGLDADAKQLQDTVAALRAKYEPV